MDYRYQIGDETITVRVEKSGAGFAVSVNGKTYAVSAAQLHAGTLTFTLDGRGVRRTAFVAADGPRRWVAFDSQPVVLTLPQEKKRARRGRAAGHDSLEAQMPGLVRQVLAAVGERVERGQTLLVLEAMKMEIKVAAPHAGLVASVAVREGETVQRGQLLVELDE